MSEPALRDGPREAGQDSQSGGVVEVVDLQNTPETRGQETFPETLCQDAQSRSNLFGESSRGSSKNRSRREAIGSDVKKKTGE